MSETNQPSMFELIDQLPAQVDGSRSILEEAALPHWDRPARVVICGMGGSAAAATLARGVYEEQAEILVSRRYTVPAPWRRGALFVFSSYSGNTEETLSAYDALSASQPDAPRIVISSGGELVDKATADAVPFLRLPRGLPPRASLGWGLGTLVRALDHFGVIKGGAADLSACAERLERGVRRWSPGGEDPGLARLATRLGRRLPLIYAGEGLCAAVAERWRAQLNENAKCLVSTAHLPELDHNEVVGWDLAAPARQSAFVLALRDEEDHPRVNRRFEVTREVLGERVGDWEELRAEPGSRLVRAMDLVQRGDYLSAYLADVHGVDPTPVHRIDELKARLSQSS